ncbi:hypothetical protein DPMN_025975 [Dreissena polymorpha]|uniref:Methylcytosine dioxygenase TET n=2 Tax=Dreissena polymorpha TaxID=45954 RepID=A0A9D4LSJ1_DREPO|nr:hypothetical protein DPMN_025975 [Dreissena polymorpha]
MEEKYLAIVRHRSGHSCATAWIIVALVAWEGVPAAQADELYDYLCTTLPAYGNETERRCGTNDRKTCACQGADLMKRGASFSFGCSWSMYFNGCKYARSSHVRKFKLKNEQEEKVLEDKLQDLATNVGPLYQQCAPEAYGNQTYLSKQGQDCRLGKEPGGPFSGVTACVDFCAHAHKDIHNMNNGSTVVVTLTKHRGLSKPDDEQLHVLPLHVLEPTDEMGSYEGQFEKIQNGGLEVLHQYPLEARLRAHPLESCRKRKLAKKGMGRGGPKSVQSAMDPSSAMPGQQKNGESVKQETIIQQPPHSHNGLPLGYMHDSRDKPISYEDLMALSAHTEFNALYDKFWDYFYVFGVFPPPSVLAQCINNMDTSAGHTLQNGNKEMSAQQEENSQFSNSPQDVPGQFRNERHSVPSNMHNIPISHQYEQMLPQSEQTGKNQGSFCDQPSTHHQQTERNGYMNVPKSQFDINVKPVQAHSNSSIPSQFSGDHQQVDNCPLNLSNDRRLRSALPNDGCALDLSFSSTTSLSSNKGRNWDSKNGTDGAKDTLSPLDLLSKAVDLRTSDLASFGSSAPALASQVNHEAHAFYTSAYKQGENAGERSLEKLPQPFGNSRSQNASAQPYHTSFPQNAGAYHHPQLPQSAPPVYELHNQHQMTIEHHLSSTNTQKMDQNKPLPDMQFQISGSKTQDKAQENLPSYIDPDVVKCEMEYNEEAFHDPEIGGVAIALSHGSVLFEVAKRELHATTGLRNPNRYHPTRISLVFYQHKHMNHEHHGMYAYDKKLQSLQMKRIEKMQLEQGYVDMNVIENSIKGGKKRYLSREDVAEEAEIAELLQRSNTKYQYMLDCSTVRTETSTTCSVSTKWIDPSPTVTGPYHKWV